jgi:hypothetical protein
VLNAATKSGISSVTIINRGYGCLACPGKPVADGTVPCGFLTTAGGGTGFRAQLMVVPCDGLSCASLNTPGTQPAVGGSVATVTVWFVCLNRYFVDSFHCVNSNCNRFFRRGAGTTLQLLLFLKGSLTV